MPGNKELNVCLPNLDKLLDSISFLRLVVELKIRCKKLVELEFFDHCDILKQSASHDGSSQQLALGNSYDA